MKIARVARPSFTSLALILLTAGTCSAAEAGAQSMAGAIHSGLIAIAAAVGLGLAAALGTLAQGRATAAAMDAIGRNPESSGVLFVPLIIGLSFMESLVLYMLVVSFVLQGKM
jgi:F-type H+-transporting ATPase subunit c